MHPTTFTDNAPASVQPLNGGSFARRLLQSGMDVEKLRSNASTLQPYEWEEVDRAIVTVARGKMTAIADFQAQGLLKQINGMSSSYFSFDTLADFNDAEVSMRAGHKANADAQQYARTQIPLPFIHKDFFFDVRALEESRKNGNGLDVTGAQLAAAKVAEKAEELIIAGITYVVGGNTLYGITNHTNVNSVTLSTYGNWDASAGNGALIIACVNAMIQASITDNCLGPWGLYIPTAYASSMNKPMNSTQTKTVGEQILDLAGFSNVGNGKSIQFIRPHAKVAANTVVLVPLDPTQVEIIEGLQITNVPWSDDGGMTLHHKVMAIYVPWVKVDAGTKTGIVKAA